MYILYYIKNSNCNKYFYLPVQHICTPKLFYIFIVFVYLADSELYNPIIWNFLLKMQEKKNKTNNSWVFWTLLIHDQSSLIWIKKKKSTGFQWKKQKIKVSRYFLRRRNRNTKKLFARRRQKIFLMSVGWLHMASAWPRKCC